MLTIIVHHYVVGSGINDLYRFNNIIWDIIFFSLNDFIIIVFLVIDGVNVGFTATFFLLYLLMPFKNVLCQKLSEKQYLVLLCIMFFIIQ